MSTLDRLRQDIKMVSPLGMEFSALWRGSTRTRRKLLGVYDYPDHDGTIVQDLGSSGYRYQMSVFFAGEKNDIEAEKFSDALVERGQWEVTHPVKGVMALQLESWTERNNPVEDINTTQFELNWIEPANIEIILSVEEVITKIKAKSEKANLSLADQLLQLKQDAFAKIQAAKNAIDSVTNAINSVLGPIAATVTEINDAFNQVTRSIQQALDAAILQPLTIARQIQQLAQLPGLVSNDFQARFESYKELAADVFGLSEDGTSEADFNKTLVFECTIGSILVASTQIAADSEFQTRPQVINAIEETTSLFESSVAALDAIQAQYADKDIDLQYFSQSQSYTDIWVLNALANKALLESSFDLKIEKRFTLDRNRSPLEITVTEYGGLGENDSNYDLFINSNNLKGNDILYLPTGREVVVYA
jgi:prophage DNA circulation protein